VIAWLLLLALPAFAQTAKPPLVVLLGGDATAWQALCRERGWQFAAPWSDIRGKTLEQRVRSLGGKVEETSKRLGADDTRVYLVGEGETAWTVFYAASRIPSVWAAAVAVGGTPRPAMDSNRLFAANTTNLPLLWLTDKEGVPLGQKLSGGGFGTGFNVEWRAEPATLGEVFDWLAAHRRDPFPASADCETGTPLFPHCYWVEMTRFDPAERNDVVDSTRVGPVGPGAALAIGPFGYHPGAAGAAGPGVLVAWLPEKYDGPLKLDDHIVELGGKEVRDGAQYGQMMDEIKEEKPAVVMIARRKQRMRLDTKVVFPPREELVTARVEARYLADLKEVEVLSRAVTQMKLTLPSAWLPAKISWNGTDVAKADAAGCWLLDEENELLSAKRCE
jgi:hypothetical protein